MTVYAADDANSRSRAAMAEGHAPRRSQRSTMVKALVNWNAGGHAFVAEAFLAGRPDLATGPGDIARTRNSP